MSSSQLHPSVLEALEAYGLEYTVIPCDPKLADTAAFCKAYGYSEEQSANTILVASRKAEPTRYVACVVLANTRLDVNRVVVKKLGVKRASFADAETTLRLSGMQIGGVTAVGIRNIPVLIDSRVMNQPEVIMGGGNRSSKLVLRPSELLKLPDAQVVESLALST